MCKIGKIVFGRIGTWMSASTLAFSAWMMLICSSRIFRFSSRFLFTSFKTSCRAISTQSINAWKRAFTCNNKGAVK
jgi:hypothetical protein